MKALLNYRRLLGFRGLLTLLSGCGKKDPAPVPTTGIAGTVRVIDQTNKVLSKEGVTVTVLNSTPALTATTTETGTFTIGAVPAGTHTLVFSRPSLSTFCLRGVAHPQSTALTRLPATYSLRQEPVIRATGLQATFVPATGGITTAFVRFETALTTPQPSLHHNYVLYFGTTPAVSFLTSTGTITINSTGSDPAATRTSNWTLSRRELEQRGFSAPAGTTVYAVAYGTEQGSLYTDLATGGLLVWPHPNLTPSPVVPFTMP